MIFNKYTKYISNDFLNFSLKKSHIKYLWYYTPVGMKSSVANVYKLQVLVGIYTVGLWLSKMNRIIYGYLGAFLLQGFGISFLLFVVYLITLSVSQSYSIK
jgi:hypothetical protein